MNLKTRKNFIFRIFIVLIAVVCSLQCGLMFIQTLVESDSANVLVISMKIKVFSTVLQFLGVILIIILALVLIT